MPESFDSMLAELADAAASATVPPDLAEVRRRARQRTLQRRMTVSALALALVGVAGGAWAVVANHHFGRYGSVAPMSGASGISAPSIVLFSGSAMPVPTAVTASPSGTGGAYEFSYGADVSVWKTAALKDGYLMIFADGEVALSSADSFPLCYGRLGSAAPGDVLKTSQTLVDVACDDFGVTNGLSVAPGSSANQLVITVSANGNIGGYTQTYTRQPSGESTTLVAVPSGAWTSVDGANRTLAIGADGTISYTALGNAGKQYTGTGVVDAYYGTAERVVINCSNAGASYPCGVFLIEASPKPGEITVFGSYGAEAFMHTG